MNPGTPGQAWRAAGIALAALLFAACERKSDQLAMKAVSARGTAFEVTTADGRTLGSDDLVGSIIPIQSGGRPIRLRIDRVWKDPLGNGEVLLHALSVKNRDGSWRPLCRPAPDDTMAGFPLAGRWSPDGRLLPPKNGEIEIVCTAGAQGKCVRLGYHPWEKLPDGSPALPLFNACVRMMRADYAGNGTPGTKDGTPIAISDRFGIQDRGWGPAIQFEAGWTDSGAVCVHHPRVRNQFSLSQIERSATRLAGLTGKACTRARAEALGALIFNGSRA